MDLATIQVDFSAAHVVAGADGAEARIHGHDWQAHIEVPLDKYGEAQLAINRWVDDNWAHRVLVWEKDQGMLALLAAARMYPAANQLLQASVVWVPFNPTPEAMVQHLRGVVAGLISSVVPRAWLVWGSDGQHEAIARDG